MPGELNRAALAAALGEAAAATFEQLAYAFATPTPTPAAPGTAPDASARVEFEGPQRGTLVLHLGGGILPALAANMLGEAGPAATPLQADALAELANVICGNVLPAVGGSRATFRLGPPRAQLPGARSAAPPAAAAWLEVEEGWAEVCLFLEGWGGGGLLKG